MDLMKTLEEIKENMKVTLLKYEHSIHINNYCPSRKNGEEADSLEKNVNNEIAKLRYFNDLVNKLIVESNDKKANIEALLADDLARL